MRERSGRQDVPERSGPSGLARRASGTSATTESGTKRRKQEGSGGVNGWARAAQLAETERASDSGAPLNFLGTCAEGVASYFLPSDVVLSRGLSLLTISSTADTSSDSSSKPKRISSSVLATSFLDF